MNVGYYQNWPYAGSTEQAYTNFKGFNSFTVYPLTIVELAQKYKYKNLPNILS